MDFAILHGVSFRSVSACKSHSHNLRPGGLQALDKAATSQNKRLYAFPSNDGVALPNNAPAYIDKVRPLHRPISIRSARAMSIA